VINAQDSLGDHNVSAGRVGRDEATATGFWLCANQAVEDSVLGAAKTSSNGYSARLEVVERSRIRRSSELLLVNRARCSLTFV
jgi:hypothetical protein